MNSKESMQVLMYYSNSDVRLEEMPIPKIGRGEILIKVIASGICGSDVMEWYRRDKVPLVLGHEVAGEVVSIGEGVDRFSQGDRVAATHHVPCNTCHYCLTGHHTVCDTLLRGTHFHPGGFAEYIRIPAINVERGVFPIADGVSYEEASFMEPLACVLRGQTNARVRPGQTVLVLGCGIAGLLHVALARVLGAGLVIAVDNIPFRLKKAEEMGAHILLEPTDGMIEELRHANEGRLADLVILCFDGFLTLSLKSIERGGTMLLFSGAAEEATLPGRVNDIFWRTEITLTSTYAGSPADCQAALDLIRAGSISLSRLISHRLPLKQGADGFKAVANPLENDCIKVIIEPQK